MTFEVIFDIKKTSQNAGMVKFVQECQAQLTIECDSWINVIANEKNMIEAIKEQKKSEGMNIEIALRSIERNGSSLC